MHNLLFRLNKTKVSALILAIALPVTATAAETYNSTLVNQTKQDDPAGKGYTLEQVFVWGNGCVVSEGKKTIEPGESTVLKVRHNCTWAGIKYKMVQNNETVGYASHSFRDKKFTIEVSQPCKDGACTLTGLPPKDTKSNS
jgi:hypothetical protein